MLTCVQAHIQDAVGCPQLVGLQEVSRGIEGWSSERTGKWSILTYRDAESWRGNAIGFLASEWQVIRRKGLLQGCWFRLRHLVTKKEVWFGSIYVSAADLQGMLTMFLNALPATTLPCVLCGDVNSPMKWQSTGGSVAPVGEDAKGRVLLDALLSKGFHVCPSREDQLGQPTSRPRKPGAQGRRIDWMAGKHVETGRVHVCTDSSQGLGTDHDALVMGVVLTGTRATVRRARLGIRVVTTQPVVHGVLDAWLKPTLGLLGPIAIRTTHVPRNFSGLPNVPD